MTERMERPSCTRHDKSVMEAVEKKMDRGPAKMAVRKSKPPLFFFSFEIALAHGHARFFSSAAVKLLA